jgi:hypothetical protein
MAGEEPYTNRPTVLIPESCVSFFGLLLRNYLRINTHEEPIDLNGFCTP